MSSKKAGVYAAVIGSMICWSFSFIWVKVAYRAYGPLTTVFFRLMIASALMFLYAKISRQLMKIKPADYLTFLLLAFFEPFLYFMGESYGLKYISSTMAAIIISTIPLFSPLAAFRFYGESLSLRNFVGIIISFLGVSLVVFDDSFHFTDPPFGMALEFLAVAAAIGYTTVLAGLAKKYNTPTIVTFQNFIAIFFFLPIWLFLEGKELLNTPFNGMAFAAIVKLAIFASVMAFVLFTYSLKHLGINRSNMFINAIPVVTALLAWYILGDAMNWRKMIGIFIVISGLFLSQIRRKKEAVERLSVPEDAVR